ncbi:hypothetical protein HAX54_020352 [Datura stramonium]|uniref:Longin domain-containing protein n=1 Tax=Datura stramonium TaxID=4076 RepID=A0ABS8S2F5_DATST|nr:hypothetical protein [Datura stramonium]
MIVGVRIKKKLTARKGKRRPVDPAFDFFIAFFFPPKRQNLFIDKYVFIHETLNFYIIVCNSEEERCRGREKNDDTVRAIARGSVVLAEQTGPTTTNASTIARQILEKIPGNNDSNVSYSQDRYIFHVKRTDGLTVLCMADDSAGRRILSHFSKKFTKDQRPMAEQFCLHKLMLICKEYFPPRKQARCFQKHCAVENVKLTVALIFPPPCDSLCYFLAFLSWVYTSNLFEVRITESASRLCPETFIGVHYFAIFDLNCLG